MNRQAKKFERPSVRRAAKSRNGIEIETCASKPRNWPTKHGFYPFDELKPCRRLDDRAMGVLEGENFFIPETENINSIIGVAAYKYKPKRFARRSDTKVIDGQEVAGFRIYRLPDD